MCNGEPKLRIQPLSVNLLLIRPKSRSILSLGVREEGLFCIDFKSASWIG